MLAVKSERYTDSLFFLPQCRVDALYPTQVLTYIPSVSI